MIRPFDDLFGRLDADPRIAEGLLRRAVRRAQRMAETGARPPGLYRDIAEIRGRAELVRQLVDALQVRDEPRARELIEDGESLFGRDALVAEVERQSRQAQLDALKSEQEAAPWPGDPEPYELDEEWLP